MPKRSRSESSDSEDEEYLESSDNDSHAPAKKNPKRARSRKEKIPATKAEVTVRATDTPLDYDKSDARKRVEKMDAAVLDRIKKMFALATHPNTSEEEARAALRAASKQLERHNVTQADVMEKESESEKLKRAGTSIVTIRRTEEPNKTFNLPAWVGTVAVTMNTFFDCQSYSTRFGGSRPRVDYAFYGLAEQTVAAAHAMEMVFNLISHWTLKPESGKGGHEKKCYCAGVARGLSDMAKKEKKQDKERAQKREQALLKARQEQEAAEDKQRLDRLKAPEEPEIKLETKVEPEPARRVKIEEVDDEDDDFSGHQPLPVDPPAWSPARADEERTESIFENSYADFNDSDSDDGGDLFNLDTKNLSPTKRSSSPHLPPAGAMGPPPELKVKLEPEEEESPWSSVGQLTAFRESSIAIGDEYLKKQGVKLLKGRKQRPLDFNGPNDSRLYAKGKKDAEKIDVRQKQIKDVDMD